MVPFPLEDSRPEPSVAVLQARSILTPGLVTQELFLF